MNLNRSSDTSHTSRTVQHTVHTAQHTAHPIWMARCKSGYTYNNRTCNRSCARGMLLCAECVSAEPVEQLTAGRMSFTARAVWQVRYMVAVLVAGVTK